MEDNRKNPVGTVATDACAIMVEGLTKRFGSFTAVDHISFSVRRGEIFGFLGANGAGKTTAMRMLCGLSRPTEGRGIVAGCDILRSPEQIKRRIGYMSQRFSLYEPLTVMDNVRLFATVYGLSDREIAERSALMFKALEMDDVACKRVAVSTIHRPQVLFLDEPTGGVDPITRRRFWELIIRAAAEGMTVFVTTHYLDEAEYCNRVSIMVDGRIAALDTPGALKERYKVETIDEVFRTVASSAKRSD